MTERRLGRRYRRTPVDRLDPLVRELLERATAPVAATTGRGHTARPLQDVWDRIGDRRA
ncbi:hypothetical protein L3Q67_24330 [Saccharothrix sp. AJ9571]|nr:hypothetical protein L3Q67_24330 [Saccharothrix sp. AJ9571]